ncbi:MAG: hypothetical protein K0S68_351 [Candidatus Saccharibacteria bacterium]|jgi:hypothetical protein|nr:hypothetical protein [Candidatus Saccharibacteria bacterium]
MPAPATSTTSLPASGREQGDERLKQVLGTLGPLDLQILGAGLATASDAASAPATPAPSGQSGDATLSLLFQDLLATHPGDLVLIGAAMEQVAPTSATQTA